MTLESEKESITVIGKANFLLPKNNIIERLARKASNASSVIINFSSGISGDHSTSPQRKRSVFSIFWNESERKASFNRNENTLNRQPNSYTDITRSSMCFPRESNTSEERNERKNKERWNNSRIDIKENNHNSKIKEQLEETQPTRGTQNNEERNSTNSKNIPKRINKACDMYFNQTHKKRRNAYIHSQGLGWKDSFGKDDPTQELVALAAVRAMGYNVEKHRKTHVRDGYGVQDIMAVDASDASDRMSKPSVCMQMVELLEETKSSVEYTMRVGSLLFSTGFCSFFLASFMVLPLFSVSLGLKYLQDCPSEKRIPIFLLVNGFCLLLKSFTSLWHQIKFRKNKNNGIFEEESGEEVTAGSSKVTEVALNIFLLAWFSCGSYWVASIWKPRFKAALHEPNIFCNRTVYTFACFQILLNFLILFIMFLFFIIVFIIHKLHYSRRLLMDD